MPTPKSSTSSWPRHRTRASASSSRTSSASAASWRRNTPPKRPPARSREGCERPAPPALREGVAQFNAGKFFEQHETIEDLWHEEGGPVRDLYHGIIQIGVGLYHRERGNHHGAVTLTRRGIARIRDLVPHCHGIDVVTLIVDAIAVLEELESLGTTRAAKVPSPVIRWVGGY